MRGQGDDWVWAIRPIVWLVSKWRLGWSGRLFGVELADPPRRAPYSVILHESGRYPAKRRAQGLANPWSAGGAVRGDHRPPRRPTLTAEGRSPSSACFAVSSLPLPAVDRRDCILAEAVPLCVGNRPVRLSVVKLDDHPALWGTNKAADLLLTDITVTVEDRLEN